MSDKLVFVTTSYKARVGTLLPKVISNVLKQTLVPDVIAIYLSSEEFPNHEEDLPIELMDVVDSNPRVKIHWSEGNIKSFKKWEVINDYTDDYIIMYDDDTIHYDDWIKTWYDIIRAEPEYLHAGWISPVRLNRNLDKQFTHLLTNFYKPGYYSTSDGFAFHSSLFKNKDMLIRYAVEHNSNDDDYWVHVMSTSYGIKTKWIPRSESKVHHKLDIELDRMSKGTYRIIEAVRSLKEDYPERFEEYMKNVSEFNKGINIIKTKEVLT